MTMAKDEDKVRRQRRFKNMKKRRGGGRGELRKMKRSRKLSKGRRNRVNC